MGLFKNPIQLILKVQIKAVMKTTKTIYLISLTIFSIAIVGAVINSIINYDTVIVTFQKLGYPTYLIHLLGAAQILGLIILVLNKKQWFVEWVYAGFFMNFSLGCIAHLASNHGNGASAVICLILLYVTYVQNRKVNEEIKQGSAKIEYA